MLWGLWRWWHIASINAHLIRDEVFEPKSQLIDEHCWLSNNVQLTKHNLYSIASTFYAFTLPLDKNTLSNKFIYFLCLPRSVCFKLLSNKFEWTALSIEGHSGIFIFSNASLCFANKCSASILQMDDAIQPSSEERAEFMVWLNGDL